MPYESAREIYQLLESNPDAGIVITTHHRPDADALGSSLGLLHFLSPKFKNIHVVSPTDFAPFLNWMPGASSVISDESEPEKARELMSAAEIVFCLDFNHLSRIDHLGKIIEEMKPKTVLMDHHQFPQNFQDFSYSDQTASSTCELIYRFIQDLNMTENINADIANCLYTGLVTDTGSFRFPSTGPKTLRIAADLMERGADHIMIYDRVYDSFSETRLRFIGYAISKKLEILREFNTALISISLDELKEFGVGTGDTEGLVNYGLSVEGIKFAALIIDRGQLVKMSFRSKGDFAANEFAMNHFEGGGHFHAAGGKSETSLDETVKKFKKALYNYQVQLNETV